MLDLQSSDYIYYTYSALSLTILAILLWVQTSYFKKSSYCQQRKVETSAYHETDTYYRQLEASQWVSRAVLLCHTVVPELRVVLLESN